MKDKMGDDILPGSIIVYGHALGRCAGLRIGKVLATESKKEKSPWTDSERTVHRITVWGVDDDSNREPTLLSKKSTLFYPERCIVLDTIRVKPKIKALLDTVNV